MTARTPDAEPLLTPAEVATMFRVDPKTVTRWAKAGTASESRPTNNTGKSAAGGLSCSASLAARSVVAARVS